VHSLGLEKKLVFNLGLEKSLVDITGKQTSRQNNW